MVQVEWDFSRQLAQRRQEQEQGSREAAEDLADLSEGEKDQPAAAAGGEQQGRVARIASDARIVSDEEDEDSKDRNLYIVLIRYVLLLHTRRGLFRSKAWWSWRTVRFAAYMGSSAGRTWSSAGTLTRGGR